jgi:hypothetical protein
MRALIAFLILFSSNAHALFEGYYTDQGGHITNLGVKVINGQYVVRGCAQYGNNPRLCRVFQATVSRNSWGDSPHWAGTGVVTAAYYNPSYGTIECQFDFQIRIYEREEGRNLIVQAYTPDNMEYQLVGPYCPSRVRNYSWGTYYGFRFL